MGRLSSYVFVKSFCFFKNCGSVRCLANIMSVRVHDPSDGDDEDAKD